MKPVGGVMATSHCHSAWRWRSHTLWMTITWLWHNHSCCARLLFGQNWHNGYLQSVIMEFS
jgi:hypothetical protein